MSPFTIHSKAALVEFLVVQASYTIVCLLLERFNPTPKTRERKALFRQQYLHSIKGVAAGTICQRFWLVFVDRYSPWNGYFDARVYTLQWMVFNVISFVFVYDTIFYWVHRLLHLKKPINFYRLFHKEHHYFETTTSAAAAVNPMEIVFLSIGLHLPKFLIPYPTWMHHILISLVLFQSILAHDSQFDYFKHRIHHQKQNYHYAFTLPFWDWIMGTCYVAKKEIQNLKRVTKNSKSLAVKLRFIVEEINK